jgi:hypothetical protein
MKPWTTLRRIYSRGGSGSIHLEGMDDFKSLGIPRIHNLSYHLSYINFTLYGFGNFMQELYGLALGGRIVK